MSWEILPERKPAFKRVAKLFYVSGYSIQLYNAINMILNREVWVGEKFEERKVRRLCRKVQTDDL